MTASHTKTARAAKKRSDKVNEKDSLSVPSEVTNVRVPCLKTVQTSNRPEIMKLGKSTLSKVRPFFLCSKK